MKIVKSLYIITFVLTIVSGFYANHIFERSIEINDVEISNIKNILNSHGLKAENLDDYKIYVADIGILQVSLFDNIILVNSRYLKNLHENESHIAFFFAHETSHNPIYLFVTPF